MFKIQFSQPPRDTDVTRTITTCQQLNIAEFELFGLAWKQWYGTPATETELERHFLPYVFDGQVPFWVRKFCLDLTDDPQLCKEFARCDADTVGSSAWNPLADSNVLIA